MRIVKSWRRGRLIPETLRHKFQYSVDLFTGHVILLHDFFHAQILKVLNDSRHR